MNKDTLKESMHAHFLFFHLFSDLKINLIKYNTEAIFDSNIMKQVSGMQLDCGTEMTPDSNSNPQAQMQKTRKKQN